MFKESKYKRWYFLIIEKASSQLRSKKNDYYESHHIIPKSLGGEEASHNKVLLTFKEHFICHRLLVKMVTNQIDKNKMRFALYCLNRCSDNQQRNMTHSQRLVALEENRRAARTRNHKPFLGRSHTTESRKKISLSGIGRDIGEEGRRKISEANIRTRASRASKVSAFQRGRIKSADHKARLSQAAKDAWARKKMVETQGIEP